MKNVYLTNFFYNILNVDLSRVPSSVNFDFNYFTSSTSLEFELNTLLFIKAVI